MTNLTRKQRELQQREQLILTTAQKLLSEQGYLGLTMDKVAEATEYSKGTIYQHFHCKEEVMANLCLQNIVKLATLFERALTFDGCSREKIAATMLSYIAFTLRYPEDLHNMHLIKNASFHEKISVETREKMLVIEHKLHETMTKIINFAIDEGDLQLNKEEIIAEELVMGLWSMVYGMLLLLSTDIQFKQMGVREPRSVLLVMMQHTLDGFKWSPLSHEKNYRASCKRIVDEMLVEELQHLSEESRALFNTMIS